MYCPAQFAELTRRLIGPSQVGGSHPARYSYHAVDALLTDLSYRQTVEAEVERDWPLRIHDIRVEKVRESDEWLAKFLDLMATPLATATA